MNCYLDYLEYLASNLRHDEHPPLVAVGEEGLAEVRKRLREELGIESPKPYEEFLLQANGYSYNGVFFFTTDPKIELPNLFEENKTLRWQRPYLQDYLVLGQSGLWLYTFHQPTSSYRALQANAIEEPYYVFEDFDDCLSSALEETLDLLEEEIETGE